MRTTGQIAGGTQRIRRIAAVATLCLLSGEVFAEEKAMTNGDVAALVEAGLGAELIIAKVRSTPSESFDLSTEGLLGLKKKKVVDEIIAAMMQRQERGKGSAAATTDHSAPEVEGQTSSKRESVGSRLVRIASLTRTTPAAENCPEAGSFVEFAKVTTPGAAQNFVGCDVTTIADFVGMGSGSFMVPGVPANAVVFRAAPPGQLAERNSLTGEAMANFVSIEQSRAELLYSLRPGDKIKLRGSPFVSRILLGAHTAVLFRSDVVTHAE